MLKKVYKSYKLKVKRMEHAKHDQRQQSTKMNYEKLTCKIFSSKSGLPVAFSENYSKNLDGYSL